MPIPNLLVAPSLLAVTVGGGPVVRVNQRRKSAQASLDQLAAQRRALLSVQIPQLVRIWEQTGGAAAVETYRETLFLLAEVDEVPTDAAVPNDVLEVSAASSQGDGKHSLAESVRLKAIERAAAAGVRCLARARTRLSTMARQIEREAASETGSRRFRRLLEASASLAAVATATAIQPVVAHDGGVDRGFSGLLRQLPS